MHSSDHIKENWATIEGGARSFGGITGTGRLQGKYLLRKLDDHLSERQVIFKVGHSTIDIGTPLHQGAG